MYFVVIRKPQKICLGGFLVTDSKYNCNVVINKHIKLIFVAQ